MSTEQINIIYVELSIEKVIQECQKEIENLQTEYADNAYQQKYKESMIMQSAETGRSSAVIVSEAIPPANPVAPKKALNVAVAGVVVYKGIFN